MDQSKRYFPDEQWAQVSPGTLGWNTGALEGALEAARGLLSTGVVILHDGRIVVEEYWPLPELGQYPSRIAADAKRLLYGHTDEGYPLEDVASVQKSVTGVLAAIAVQKGVISFDDPVERYLGPGWARVTPQQSGQIAIRHLMTMTSGLSESLDYVAPPGTQWRYNTGAYQNVLRILSRAAGLEANALTRAWLSDRIGMAQTRWVERNWAVQTPPMMGLVTTPRDLARFGLLLLRRGNWNGEQIVGASRLDRLTRQSQPLNPAYGMLFWLNTEAGVLDPATDQIIPGQRIPDAPADMITAAGALNRYVFVLPADDIVVVRTGLSNASAGAADNFAKNWWPRLCRVFG